MKNQNLSVAEMRNILIAITKDVLTPHEGFAEIFGEKTNGDYACCLETIARTALRFAKNLRDNA